MSSLEDFSSVLKENEKINSEIVKVILKELTEKLKKSKVKPQIYLNSKAFI
jgi:uncharacterized protein YneF (UPF0154 family)